MGISKKRIILDCDLMKYPDSGLYHYCLNLGTAIHSLLEKDGEAGIAFHVPPVEARSFGPDALHIIEKKSVWNFFNPFLRGCTIWHAPFQSGRIFPDKKKYPREKNVAERAPPEAVAASDQINQHRQQNQPSDMRLEG